MEDWVKLLGGIVFLAVVLWLLSIMIKKTKNGYRDKFGSDIDIYFGSILFIILGLTFIWQVLF